MMRPIVLMVTMLLFISCGEKDHVVTNPEDYDRYLAAQPQATTSKYFELWNSKITPDSLQLMSFGNVASEYNRYFQNTGNIEYLKKAEQALAKAVEIANINKAAYYRALARNYISQHRFKEALQLADLALAQRSGLKATQSLLFDVHMELGNYDQAEKYLDHIKSMSDFGFLIRMAKWSDYKGDLDTTINFMERALKRADAAKSKTLLLWSYTNLADYYGHAGRITDSYEYYLKALELDPQNAYAKKGIAWILFSYEKNGAEALRILDAVTEYHKAPDYYLLKAEINEFMGNVAEKRTNLDRFYAISQNSSYGDMYNAHQVDLALEDLKDYDSALYLASKEVANRPTPGSYDLLAHTYYKIGEQKKALQVVEEHIIGKTYEPGILLNVAQIYKANKMYDEVALLRKELMEASYELGPASELEIANL